MGRLNTPQRKNYSKNLYRQIIVDETDLKMHDHVLSVTKFFPKALCQTQRAPSKRLVEVGRDFARNLEILVHRLEWCGPSVLVISNRGHRHLNAL